MQRKYSYLEYKKALFHYSEYGRGKNILICFHGYGQTLEHFNSLEEVFKEEYTVYSFDLFYHGKSFWHEKDKPLSKEFWAELMNVFLKEKNIQRFSLLGFSMGGKFAFATLDHFYSKIDKLILIAPDGVKTNFWYSLATYPGWMRKIFRRIIVKPGVYFKLVKVLSALNLMDKGILRFANTQMSTKKQRRKVYYSWMVFKDLQFDMNEIASILNSHSIRLELFLGEYDKIITQKNMRRLLDKLNDYQINVLQSGHTSLIEAVAKHYRNIKKGPQSTVHGPQ